VNEEKDEARPLVGVLALCSLQCFDTGLVVRRTSVKKPVPPVKKPVALMPEILFQNMWRRTQGELAVVPGEPEEEPGSDSSSGKMAVKRQ